MQICPTCGSQNPDDADVCADCGMELPGHGAAPAAPSAPASVPETPAAAPYDFAPEAAPTPDAASPIPTPAPVEASGNDPFAGNEWNFDLDKGTTPAAEPEASAPVAETPAPSAIESAPTQLIEPAPTPVAPPVSTPAAGATGGAELILKRGGAPTGDVFSIGQSATVGRFDPESGPVDVDMAQLPESVYISRHHAEINLRDGQWMVKDLGSRNGTFVKNAAGFARVTEETPVTNGDEIAFGNARFEFQIA